ncbi:MAG: hypothetical protein C0594_01190 [Marinilabiliales bacterium]|nr:MAG: hypothetical protein C0594_01190 [Marinilabiliales bacterium]
MKLIFSAPQATFIHNLKNILDTYNIDTKILGEHRSIGVGDLPPVQCWIELWVLDDKKESSAMEIIHQAILGSPEEGEMWTCNDCGEKIEPQFTHCWNCGAER